MADSTINELVNLTSVANNDELVLWDTSASETKKATVSNVVTPVATSIATTTVGTTSGIMATGTCSTAAGTAQKVVTSAKWTNKPGESIMVEFTYENTADNVTLKIGSNSAIPVYALNTAIRLGSGTIPAGPMIFTLSADGTKFYAHTVVVDTEVTSGSSNPVTSGAVENYVGKTYSVSGSVHPTVENQHFEICRLTVPAGQYVVIGYSEFNVSANNVYNLRLLYAAGSMDRIVRGNSNNGGGIINSYIVQGSEPITIVAYGYGYSVFVNNENAKQSATIQAIKIGD